MTDSTGNTCIQRLGISKTSPMIHAVSSRPEETTRMGVNPFWRVLPDATRGRGRAPPGLHDLDAEQRARIIHATRGRV
jgi:hypothetical protein